MKNLFVLLLLVPAFNIQAQNTEYLEQVLLSSYEFLGESISEFKITNKRKGNGYTMVFLQSGDSYNVFTYIKNYNMVLLTANTKDNNTWHQAQQLRPDKSCDFSIDNQHYCSFKFDEIVFSETGVHKLKVIKN